MTITEYLIEKSEGLLSVVPEVSDSTGRYLMFDDGGVEIEVGEFLYGLTRLVKPLKVLTTGVYTGVSDMYIAQALKDNRNDGVIEALEIEDMHLTRAIELWRRTEVGSAIFPWSISSLAFEPKITYDMMFLDSEPQIRFQELINFFPHLNPGGYVGIHDLHSHMGQVANEEHGFAWPWGEMPNIIKEWVKDRFLVPFHFNNPRGLTFFYKPREVDYQWL